jgi:hypothetical protein
MEDGGSETSSDADQGQEESVDSSSEVNFQHELSPAEATDHGQPLASGPEVSSSAGSTRSNPSETQIKPDSKPSLRYLLTNAYRDLLNATISSARCDDIYNVELEDSVVGSSYWTSSEKEALFSRLGRCASSDLRTLSDAVSTKSESEVFMYLKLLHDNSVENHAQFPFEYSASTTADAAWEISPQCEDTLDAAADALARHISKHDVITEQTRFGNDWLLTQDSASLVDRQYAEYEIARSLKREDDTGDPKDAASLDDETHGNVSELHLSPVDELLRPSEFLALARTVLMNSAEGDSWHTMEDIIGPCQEPTIYRSALETIHELAVTFTRRLCLTALTQTASRLRSHTVEHPVAVVTARDVRTACDILNVPSEGDEFWATCPRRCRLKIYSDSEKYNDGRDSYYPSGSHRPARFISYDEAEKELRSEAHDNFQSEAESEEEPEDDDVEAALNDGEFLTDASDSSNEDTESRAMDRREDGINDEEKIRRVRPITQRRWLKLEESHLDETDSQSSREEVQRLWKILRLRPPESRSVPTSTPSSLSRAPLDLDLQYVAWRERMQWIAPWEHEEGLPDPRAFWEVNRRGRAKRKHREGLKKKMQDRLTANQVESSDRAENTVTHQSRGDDGNEFSPAE